MLHRSARRFSTGVPVSATRQRGGQRARRLRRAGEAFLMFCASSSTSPSHVHGAQAGLVAVQQRVRAEHHVVLGAAVGQSLAAPRPAPWCTSTRKAGANRASSRRQLPTTEVGQTITQRRRAGRAVASCEQERDHLGVLPSPMSSARQAPRP